jgi:hypothetical protein
MCESREAELELAEAAFGADFQLVNQNDFETVFIIQMSAVEVEVTLTFTLDAEFPRIPLRCMLNGSLMNSRRESLSQHIQNAIEESPDIGLPCEFAHFTSDSS